MDDPTFSGPPPTWIDWVDSEQMPSLAKVPHYQQQFYARLDDLRQLLANLEQQIAGGRLDLQPEADRVAGEITWLTDLVEAPHA